MYVASKLNKYKHDFKTSEDLHNIYTVMLHSKGTPTCLHVKFFKFRRLLYYATK